MSAARTEAPVRPAEALAALGRALASPTPPRLILVVNAATARADEPYLREASIARVADAARARDADVTIADAAAPGFDASALYASIATRSLFAATCVRVVKNADALVRGASADAGAEGEGESNDDSSAGVAVSGDAAPSRASSSRAAAHAPIERAALAFAATAPEGDALVLAARKLRAPFVRAAREAGAHVVTLRPLYDRPFRGDGPIESTELGEFAASMAGAARMKLARGALGALLARTGNQLGSVAAALEKLRAVVGDREISAADVAAHVARSTPGSPWALAEAILTGDAPRALTEIAAIAAAGARDGDGRTITSDGAFVMALASLVRDGRRNVRAATALARGASLGEAASAAGVPAFPSAIESFERAMRARSLEEHRRFLDELADVERSTRSLGEKLRSALERLAVRTRARASASRAARAAGR